MKIYLVGGAVRDELLAYPVLERDYVVVGTSPNEMKSKGFIPVGKDFPVFLHPDTKEEYALARTERKSGHGYHGFEFNTDSSVSLEEDLVRRDLTINAMAKSDSGEIIDPLNGQKDLRNKCLRHIGDSFQEDPVRILRVARFAARYAHLGFSVHEDTIKLMRKMVEDGEANHLVPERVWKEFSRALEEKSPNVFIETLFTCGALDVISPKISALLLETHDTLDTHPSMKALAKASKIIKSAKIRLATFLSAMNNNDLDTEFFQSLSIPNEYRDLIRIVAKNKKSIENLLNLCAEEIVALLSSTDAFRKPERFNEALDCTEIFHQANNQSDEFWQAEFLSECLKKCTEVLPNPFIAKGYKGVEIGKKIQEERIKVVENLLSKAR